MKWYRYVWGIIMICAIALAVRAFLVFTSWGKQAAVSLGEACIVNAARSLSRVIDYAAEYGDEEALESAYYLLGAKGLFPEFPTLVSREVAKRSEAGEYEPSDRADAKAGLDDMAGGGIISAGTLLIEYAQGGVEPVFATRTYPNWSERIDSLYPITKMQDVSYLMKNYYIVDSSTSAVQEEFDLKMLLSEDLTIEKKEGKPQILIYHTHGSEGYIDSRAGNYEDTVMGVGAYLTELLVTQYGYEVYHDTNIYDRKDGKDNRNYAYSTAIPYVTRILEQNPSIEVVIDLHRDGGSKRTTVIDGENVAQIMLFNGLCRNANGPIAELANPYLEQNLAFSLRLNLVGSAMYPGLMYKIYLKNYRYNMHLCPKSLLVELGTNQNTLKEAMNAMPYFAAVLDQVLQAE